MKINSRLTGRFLFKKNIWGSLILYVEEIYNIDHPQSSISPDITNFRKAKEEDLIEINIFNWIKTKISDE
jgi:hypothetical protein